MDFRESDQRLALRAAVSDLGKRYGHSYLLDKARNGGKTTELWAEAGRYGYLGVNIPAEYGGGGGGGGGIGDLAAVCEELAAAGCPLLLTVVSPAICGSVIARLGTEGQKRHWLPGLADGSITMAFAITEPDAGSNSHNLTTFGRRTADGWSLSGRKVFISGVDESDAVLVVGRIEDTTTGRLRPALFIVPTDAPGFTYQQIDMELVSPEKQFQVFIDDVALPLDALVGESDVNLLDLFAGLNPERIMVAAFALGMARHALDRAVEYAKSRVVWRDPIGAHQGLSHPLAVCAIELEAARLLTYKAAWLYDVGDDVAAGEAANMAKYAAAEAAARVVDQAVQTFGGYGLSTEYGIASMLTFSRVARIAPISREMILNFVAAHTLGLPRSY